MCIADIYVCVCVCASGCTTFYLYYYSPEITAKNDFDLLIKFVSGLFVDFMEFNVVLEK